MAKRKTVRKNKAKMKSSANAKGKSKPGYDFIIRRLEKNPKAVYGDIAAAASKAGHTVYPVMFGRAKLSLGLVKSAPRGEGKASRVNRVAVRRGPGRPRKSESASNGSAIATVIQSMREQETENDRLRSTLTKIRALLDSAL